MLVGVMISCGTDTPLGEYRPASKEEAAVKSLLLGFQDGVNRRNFEKVGDLIHDDAVLMLGRERNMVSKSDYIKMLPQRLADRPLISLGRPKMDLKGNTADVRIYIRRGNARFLVTYHLKRDENRWKINGWTY